jgi:hypothetical protein
MAMAYALLNQKAKAMDIVNDLWKTASQYMEWYLALDSPRFMQSHNECITQIYVMQRLHNITEIVDQALADKQMKQIESFYSRYTGRGGIFPQG